MDETSTSSEESSPAVSLQEDSSTIRFEYANEAELLNEMQSLLKDPGNLDNAANYLYQSILDETVLGIIFELHRAVANGSSEAIEGQPEDSKPYTIVDLPDFDMFGMHTAKKPVDFNCPNCERLVVASRFAPHLEKCMGMGRNSSRIASRRIANAREGNSSYFNSNPSDDEDDADWSGEKRRKKMQNIRTNGVKKNGKSGS